MRNRGLTGLPEYEFVGSKPLDVRECVHGEIAWAMPKKGKKKKGPAIDETPSVVFEHTGFHPHDLVCAPFGESVTVVTLSEYEYGYLVLKLRMSLTHSRHTRRWGGAGEQIEIVGVVVSTVRKRTDDAAADDAAADDAEADEADEEPSSPRLRYSWPSPLMLSEQGRRDAGQPDTLKASGNNTNGVSPCAVEKPKLSSKFSASLRLGRWFPCDQARLKNFKR
jgi:hypothetical protein